MNNTGIPEINMIPGVDFRPINLNRVIKGDGNHKAKVTEGVFGKISSQGKETIGTIILPSHDKNNPGAEFGIVVENLEDLPAELKGKGKPIKLPPIYENIGDKIYRQVPVRNIKPTSNPAPEPEPTLEPEPTPNIDLEEIVRKAEAAANDEINKGNKELTDSEKLDEILENTKLIVGAMKPIIENIQQNKNKNMPGNEYIKE